MSGFESEIIKPFPEAPISLPDFFRSSVERLLLENLDYTLAKSWDTTSLEVLHLIDRHPLKGLPIRYNYVYHLFDSDTFSTTLGLVLANPETVKGYQAFRRGSTRHYTYVDQGSGSLLLHYSNTYKEITETSAGTLEDPYLVNDPLDDSMVHALKVDVERLKNSTPIRPLSNLAEKFIDL